MCLLSLVALIVQMSEGYYWGAGLIASFFIPLLGWCGARFRSRCTMLLFSVANLVMMFVFFAITVPFLMCAFARCPGVCVSVCALACVPM